MKLSKEDYEKASIVLKDMGDMLIKDGIEDKDLDTVLLGVCFLKAQIEITGFLYENDLNYDSVTNIQCETA